MKQIQTRIPGKKALMFVISEASLFPKMDIQGLSSWNCHCMHPTNFTSKISGYVIHGCPEHEIEFDVASIYSIDEHKQEIGGYEN